MPPLAVCLLITLRVSESQIHHRDSPIASSEIAITLQVGKPFHQFPCTFVARTPVFPKDTTTNFAAFLHLPDCCLKGNAEIASHTRRAVAMNDLHQRETARTGSL